MASIEPRSWGPPVAYLYTLKLDDLSRAWEYLRRNRQYCREFSLASRDQQRNLRPSSWGLLHWEDPREDARSVEPAWLSVGNSEIVLVQEGTGRNGPSFDPWKIPGRKTLRHDGEYVRLTARRGSEVLYRVRWPENLRGTDPVGISVAGGSGFTARARSARRFLRLLGRHREEDFPEPIERPSINTLTHMCALQALDGDAAGASHREIARRIFGLSDDSSWDSDSRWRARARYLIRCGRARSAHGYRRMAGLDSQERDSDDRDPTATPRASTKGSPRKGLQRTQHRAWGVDTGTQGAPA